MKHLLKAILIVCFSLPCAVYAQTIQGVVRGEDGPIVGASVQEKDVSTNGVITGANGSFTLTLKGVTKTILVTAVGYLDKEITIKDTNAELTIIMEQNAKGLDDVIVVGYGTTKKITNTGAVTSVSAADVRNIPTSNIQNTLIGRAPGFISQQRTGQPGMSGAEFYIRGVNSLSGESQKPLIIVDDVEYTYDQVSQLDVNEIESFSILKDASTTAVYGIKGANGVLVITTKRGKIGKPMINANTEHAMQTPVTHPKFLDAYTVAQLRNEALRNDGLPEEFTQEDLEHWRLKDDPYGHPDVDWYHEVFKKYSYQTRNTIDISGGTPKIKYFISAGHLFQDGYLRNFSRGDYEAPKNNYAYQRFTFRSNLDMQATNTLKLRLDVTGRTGTTTEPHISTSPLATVYSYQRLPPYAAPLINPDGSYPWAFRSRNIYWETSLIGRLALQGYDKTFRNELNILFNAEQRLDFITKGLSVSWRVAYAGDISYDRSLYRNNIPAFYFNPVDSSYTIHSNGLYRLEPLTLSSSPQNTISRKTVNTLAKLNYARSFGKHNVRGMLLYNLDNVTRGSYNSATGVAAVQEYAPVVLQGTTLRLEYNYLQRYLLEFNGAYNGSSQFVGRHTKGFFPAISAGWNIAEENFFKNITFVDMLKIRASWGLTGSDVTAGNVYKTEQVYNPGPNYNFGETSNNFPSIQEGTLGNLDITWEKSRKTNVGIDAQLFNNKLSVTVDYFYDYRYDQLYVKDDVLKIIGVGLPYTNSAITENKGFDGQVSYYNRKDKLSYGATFTFSRARNKILYQGEATPRYPHLARTGRPIGQAFGYHVLGFFQTQEEVDNYPHLADAKPGDLKYEDVNGDGAIDQQDYVPIGKPNLPQTVLGTSLSFGYGNFSLNILFQGSFDYSYRISTNQVIPFQANLQKVALGRWTPETAATATFPRLSSILAGPSSPSNSSDFWMVTNAYYIRFKNIELGYQIPKSILRKFRISAARLYASGYNLYTWANFKLYNQDPEIQSGGSGAVYPVQKVYNIGLQIGF